MSFIILNQPTINFRVAEPQPIKIHLNASHIIRFSGGDSGSQITLSNNEVINVTETADEINDKLRGVKVKTQKRPPEQLIG